MTVVRTLGKNTLGDNNKMKVAMRDYDMSTHDISTIFRSSVGVGMLVPFCKILCQKGGAVQDSIVDVNYNTARKIQKEVENFYYDMITKRMSAEAAKEQAAAMIDKIAKDYELGKGHLDNENQKNLREWIFGGINQMSEIIESLSKFKQAQSLLKRLEKVIRKPNE
jgi:hypothetical protein